ncbi:DUF1564 family protein [Leptospira sp. 201903071]|uniref:DUF1564 family protein n=1 Tax=Leptospira ainazelensis TaxID=2810034 RepID=UPI0019669CE6|nr:DUF1564 family protein [Leptospira ainazelensis]MBM9500482.1 DUF1564 family protein [Leptospira ainazelensis]
MRTKKEKQPIRHLRLLKPHRSKKDLSSEKESFFFETGGFLKKIGSPSDLNVPKELIPYLEKRILAAGSLRMLLNQCLKKKTLLVLIQFHFPRNKIGYQKQRLRLIRFSFRPFEEDWIELKRLSFFHGISMCRMFVKLLEMDLYPESKFAENPFLEKSEVLLPPFPELRLKTGT